MIEVHPISPVNEMRVAEQLKAMIATAWPDVAESKRDRVDLLVGVRAFSDCDILALVRLDRPREIPSQLRRHGATSPPAEIQYALIEVEVKQLDQDRFERIGNQLFPIYNGRPSERSCADQAKDAAMGLSTYARQNGHSPFVYHLAWLTEVDDAFLQPIDPSVVGREVTWFGMLDAAIRQHAPPTGTAAGAWSRAVDALRQLLLTRRRESRRDRDRIEKLSRDRAGSASLRALAARAGTAQVRLIGRGGSGKTTSLALLAVHLAEAGERILILTFHRMLRTDITAFVSSLGQAIGLRRDRIMVESATAFLVSALADLEAEIPYAENGDVDYRALDGVLHDAIETLVEDADGKPGDVSRLRAENPERFAWDYVFIDEAQDWSDAERDFVRALYGHRRIVVADGVDQLVRRQTTCDWNAGIPENERVSHHLDSSLRMLRHVATFANCFARALGLDTWRIDPQADLAGGRVIVAVGDVDAARLLPAMIAAADEQRADAADCLVCLPPRGGKDDSAREQFIAAGAATGVEIWDGTLPENRDAPPSTSDALRLVRYDSCRGLEGWITVALELDQFANNRLKYPNFHPDDPPIDPEIVLKRWLLIPFTRAVHTLILTVRDPQSFLVPILREAAADAAMPRGVVEFVDASRLPDVLARDSVAS